MRFSLSRLWRTLRTASLIITQPVFYNSFLNEDFNVPGNIEKRIDHGNIASHISITAIALPEDFWITFLSVHIGNRGISSLPLLLLNFTSSRFLVDHNLNLTAAWRSSAALGMFRVSLASDKFLESLQNVALLRNWFHYYKLKLG